VEDCLIWNEADVEWNTNEYYWNLCEVIVEVPAISGGFFVDPRKKRHSYRWEVEQKEKKEKKKKEEKRYIKLVCLINDEKFEETKYVGKKISVESFDETLIIASVKRINISVDEIHNVSETKGKGKIMTDNIKVLYVDDKKTRLKIKKIKPLIRIYFDWNLWISNILKFL